MSSDNPENQYPSLVGFTLLLALAIAGLWLATAVVVPSAQYIMQLYGTRIPALFNFAIPVGSACFHLVYPLAFIGFALLVAALFRRRLPRLAAACQTGLRLLAGVVAGLSIYLLGSGGVAYKLASTDQLREIMSYKRTFEEFALLEAAEGRFEKLASRRSQGLKMVEVRSVSQFDNTEARERISSLMSALRKTTDTESKRRILATLSLFRDRAPKDSYYWRDVVSDATAAGAPPSESHVETFDWIAANLNKDGWDPLPLFKFGR
jgi:hypothetical protein